MKRSRRASGQTLNLLHALMEAPRSWHHGYELSRVTGLLSGTLYPILMRLSDQGFLEDKWQQTEEAGRPPRHVYRLTAKGVTYAREQFAACEDAGTLASGSVSRA